MKKFYNNIYVQLFYFVLLLIVAGFNIYYIVTKTEFTPFLNFITATLAIFILFRWSFLIIGYFRKRNGN